MPCSSNCMQPLLLVWNTFTRIFSFWLLSKNLSTGVRWKTNLFLELYWQFSHELCLRLCVSSKATCRQPLVLWAMETASTMVDPKTKVSKNKKQVKKVRFRFYRYYRCFLKKQLLQVVVSCSDVCCRPFSVLQWWLTLTVSYWWWSLLVSHPPGSSVWSERPAAKYRSLLTQTQSRWPHGWTRKVSQNRKSPQHS